MDIKNRIKRWTNEQKAKKNSKEPERNPFFSTDYCTLKTKIEHQGIGGKKAYFDRTNLELVEILEKAIYEHNIACLQFVKRRPDLFRQEELHNGGPIKMVTLTNYCYPAALKKKYHYVKIWNTNPGIYPEYTYLGYVICSDEIKMAYHVGGSK